MIASTVVDVPHRAQEWTQLQSLVYKTIAEYGPIEVSTVVNKVLTHCNAANTPRGMSDVATAIEELCCTNRAGLARPDAVQAARTADGADLPDDLHGVFPLQRWLTWNERRDASTWCGEGPVFVVIK